MPRSPVNVSSYVNRSGSARVSTQMPRSFALRIALRDTAAIAELVRVITARIEHEERPDE